MTRYEIGFIDGFDLRYKVITVMARNADEAREIMLTLYGASFEHYINYIREA